MRLIEVTDASRFIQLTQKSFQSYGPASNMIYSSALALAKTSTGRSKEYRFFVVSEDANKPPSAALLNVKGRKSLLWSNGTDATGFLATELTRHSFNSQSVFGESVFAEIFAQAFTKTATHQVVLEQFFMELRRLAKYDLAPGFFRLAGKNDLKTLTHWSRQFVAECKLEENLADESEELIQNYFENEQMYVWETDRLVAMGAYGGLTPDGARLFMIYTEPKARGHGFAKSLTYRLSLKLLREGYAYCSLFADVANPISTRMYRDLGYTDAAVFKEVRLT